jgi:disulfide bond formation protein DsbB
MGVITVLRRHWPVAALLASAAMLATAHAFQAAGYRPCLLCLRQREVYWAAIAIAVAALVAPRLWKSPFLPRAGNALLGGAFLVGFGVAAYHAGVEWKWWPGPATCANLGGGAITADDIAAALGASVKVVPCDEVAWSDPVLNLSMAAWNALVSVGLSGFSFFAAAAPVERTPDRD